MNPEIAQLRREEDFKALANSIADAAIYVFLSEPEITGPVKNEAIRVAVERYGDRLPAPMIANIVYATIAAEMLHRNRQKVARLEQKKESVRTRANVLRSGRILGG